MNRIFVLKDIAYAAKVGGGVIAGVNEINDLSPGALAFFTPQGTLLTLANAAATIPDIKSVIVASGREADNNLVNYLPRVINNINRANFRAFTKPVITVGAFSIAASDEGDASIRVSDISYTSRYSIRPLNGSTYKKSNHTIEQAVDAMVSRLNLPNSWVVATKTDVVGVKEQFTITVDVGSTADGTATIDIDGVSVDLPLTNATIAINTAEITAVIDALPDWTATDDGTDVVTAVAVLVGTKTDVANYSAGGATTSAVTLATPVQGVDSLGTFTVAITPKDDGVAIEVALDGLVSGDNIAETTATIYGIGGGIAILQMEKDFSVEEGNGNYIDYTAEWYKRNMESLVANNYDLITTTWDGEHKTPSQVKSVMHNRVVIATINGAGNGQAATDILAIMALIWGNTYSATTGFEIATDDGTDYDGVPGN